MLGTYEEHSIEFMIWLIFIGKSLMNLRLKLDWSSNVKMKNISLNCGLFIFG